MEAKRINMSGVLENLIEKKTESIEKETRFRTQEECRRLFALFDELRQKYPAKTEELRAEIFLKVLATLRAADKNNKGLVVFPEFEKVIKELSEK